MNGISSLVAEGAGKVDVAGEIHSLGVLARREEEGAELWPAREGSALLVPPGSAEISPSHRRVFCAQTALSGHSSIPRTQNFCFSFPAPHSAPAASFSALLCWITPLQGGVPAFICGAGTFLTAPTPRIPENEGKMGFSAGKQLLVELCHPKSASELQEKGEEEEEGDASHPWSVQGQAGGGFSNLEEWKVPPKMIFFQPTPLWDPLKAEKLLGQKFSGGFTSWREKSKASWPGP